MIGELTISAIVLCIGLFAFLKPDKWLAATGKYPWSAYYWVGKLGEKRAHIIVKIVGICFICCGLYLIIGLLFFGIKF